MLSRKDIRPFQTQHLLRSGLIPVAVDHRLCPETSIISGAMNDLCHALAWARNVLPKLALKRHDVVPDGTKIVVIGWSTGGMLAMSLGWTAPQRGLDPPEGILAFYSPTDYQDKWWKEPHFPWRTSEADMAREYDLWEGVREAPITGYNVASSRAPGGWMSTLDARARIPLHMNWTAQTLPVLLGLMSSERKVQRDRLMRQQSGSKSRITLAEPSEASVREISALAQIRAGKYHSPTYLLHGSEDEFIPWQQSHSTYEALVEKGIPAGISVVERGGHIFEMLGVAGDDGKVWQAVLDGYEFVFKLVGIDSDLSSV